MKELKNVQKYRKHYQEPHGAITQLPQWATWLILFCFCTTHSPTSPPPNYFEANPRRIIISSLNTSLCCAVLSHSVVSDSLGLRVLQFTRLLCPWGFSRREYWSGLPCPPPGDLPNPGIEPRSSALQADSLPSEPSRKPKNTGVGSLSLLQGIFLTWESNRGLLHCRQILYQLSYQGNPNTSLCIYKT